MNCKQANQISLNDFLQKHNFKPKRKSGDTTFYFSPFRLEKEASFIVNSKNKWHDFGSGEHGDIIDFVMKWHNCDRSKALKFIDGSPISFSFHKQEFIENSSIKIRNVRPFVKHKALLDYLEYRAIKPLEAVKHELKEVWYTKDDKLYFGIAFENDLGGYELRNKFYKNCIGKKAITTRLNRSSTILVWEGWLDYISYLILNWSNQPEDHLILNSTSMHESAISILKKYKKVLVYLDNDQPGKDCFYKIIKEVPWIIDQSHTFYPFKDLNEFLINQKK